MLLLVFAYSTSGIPGIYCSRTGGILEKGASAGMLLGRHGQ